MIPLADDEHLITSESGSEEDPLTGRTIIIIIIIIIVADRGLARHRGAGCFGTDLCMLDRSAANVARRVAKNVVTAGAAEKVEVQVGYTIGVASRLSLLVEMFGTEKVPLPMIRALVEEQFDPRAAAGWV
jgi:S-adenosylmethionine synthetase